MNSSLRAEDLIALALKSDLVPWPTEPPAAFEETVLASADAHGVTTLLGTAPATASWPERIRLAFRDARRRAVAAEAVKHAELTRVLRGFAAAHVRPLLLKGAHLAYTFYQSPSLRPRIDTDLLVRPADRRRAHQVLLHLGYQPHTHFDGDLVTHQFSYERRNRYGWLELIDLHWKVANPQVFAGALSTEELAREAVRIPGFEVEAFGPSTSHALALACMHRVAHHDNSDRLIWLYDIHLLTTQLGPAGLDAFVSLAASRQLSSVCAAGIARAQETFGTPLPERSLARLRAGARRTEPTAAFLRPGLTPLDILRSDLRQLGSWSARLRLIREHLFPPVAYMRKAYGLRTPALVPLAFAYRIALGASRWLRRH
jgi:hypothetical protein